MLLDRSQRYAEEEESEGETIARQQAFMHWLTRALMRCLYPGAPYERRRVA